MTNQFEMCSFEITVFEMFLKWNKGEQRPPKMAMKQVKPIIILSYFKVLQELETYHSIFNHCITSEVFGSQGM